MFIYFENEVKERLLEVYSENLQLHCIEEVCSSRYVDAKEAIDALVWMGRTVTKNLQQDDRSERFTQIVFEKIKELGGNGRQA